MEVIVPAAETTLAWPWPELRQEGRLTAESSSCWTPELSLVPGAGREVVLPIWPAATLSGELRAESASSPDQEQNPATLTLGLESPPSSVGTKGLSRGGAASIRVPPSKVSCRVVRSESADGEDRWSCLVPRATLDLRFGAAGFAPVYRWDQEPPRGDKWKLAALRLQREATLAGWLRVAEVRKLPRDVWVEALPERIGEVTVFGLEERLDRRLVEGDVTDRGFFQLRGLEPGRYRLVAGAAGFANAVVGGVQILEQAETLLPQPVELQAPAQLELVVTPGLDPRGLPLEIEWWGKSLSGEEERTVYPLRSDGSWLSPPLSPGRHYVAVRSSGWAQWKQEKVELSPGKQTHFLDLPFYEVEGVVEWPREALEVLGDRGWRGARGPFADASLWLTGTRRDRNRAQMDLEAHDGSAEDGLSFTGVLAQAGRWYPKLRLPALGEWVHFEPVEVQPQDGGQAQRLTLRVPSGSLLVEVVDSEGQPIPGADLRLSMEGNDLNAQPIQVRTDREGLARMSFLREGEHRLVARAMSRAAVRARVRIEGSEHRERLELPGRTILHGRLVDPQGKPLLGAQLIGLPKSCADGEECQYVPGSVNATTSLDGRFELNVGENASELKLFLLAPGQALTLRTLRVPSADSDSVGRSMAHPITLQTEGQGGTLYLPEDFVAAGLQVSLDGVPITSSLLRRWAQAHGSKPTVDGLWPIPQLESATYQACWWTADNSQFFGCEEVHLSPGGEAFLQPPDQVAKALE
ncbi:MAG: carboxypeptidase-like regulatory domain-containing protein [Acidobacteriota bacterium]